MTQSHELWFTKQQLFACAEQRGFQPTEELFREWIERGLMGEAGQREWPGRGSIARWSRSQLDLFLILLQFRQRGPHQVRIGPLCNVPVWKWLYWNELGGVTLKQVRKALATWVAFRKHIPRATVRRNARNTVELTKGPLAKGVRDLVDILTSLATFDHDYEFVDQEELFRIVEPVTTAYPKHQRERGPVKGFFGDPDYLSTMIPLRSKALEYYQDLEQLPDAVWHWARVLLLVTTIQGMWAQSELGTDPELGYRFPYLTLNALCESSCYYLLTILGMAQQRAFHNHKEWPYLDPVLWEKGELAAVIRTSEVHGVLFLPGGERVPYLRNDIAIHRHGVVQQKFSLDLSLI